MGTEIDELVDIVEHVALAEERALNHAGDHGADGQAVGFHRLVKIIGSSAAAGAGHVLHDDVGMAGNMFLQRCEERSRAQIAGAAGVGAAD